MFGPDHVGIIAFEAAPPPIILELIQGVMLRGIPGLCLASGYHGRLHSLMNSIHALHHVQTHIRVRCTVGGKGVDGVCKAFTYLTEAVQEEFPIFVQCLVVARSDIVDPFRGVRDVGQPLQPGPRLAK